MGTKASGYHLAIILLALSIILFNYVVSPVILQIILYTILTIYSGSKSSVEHGNKICYPHVFTEFDAFMFPVLGSFILITVYFAYKIFGIYHINLLMCTYLTIIGCVSLTNLFYNFFHPYFVNYITDKSYNIPNTETPIINLPVDLPLYSIISLFIITAWIKTKHWTLHNIIGISFCIEAIRTVSIGSLVIGGILLWGLFIYDIFWIFGTNVMTTIAKVSEAPIKLFLPYTSTHKEFGIIGLGDIVLPGIFISMIMKFDNYIEKTNGKRSNHFWVTLFSYQIGLSFAGFVLNKYNTGQPALLYLVPSISLGFLTSVYMSGHATLALKFEEKQHVKDL